jgi:FkbM family methyltransferase
MELEKIRLIDDTTVYGVKEDYITNTIKQTKNYYEFYLLQRFTSYIPRECVIYDIGANIGNHTLYFYKYLDPKEIYVFEPMKDTFDILTKNIETNFLKNTHICNVAVGETDTYATMNLKEKNLGGSYIDKEGEGDIKVISLDGRNFTPPTFIKIDVEGFEYKVLKGMENMLINHSPIIWVEVFRNHVEDITAYLNSLNYEMVERVENNSLFIKKIELEDKLMISRKLSKNMYNYYADKLEDARDKYRFAGNQIAILKDKLNEKDRIVSVVEVEKEDIVESLENIKEQYVQVEEENKELHSVELELEKRNKELKEKDLIIQQKDMEIQKQILELKDQENKINILGNRAATYLNEIEKKVNEIEELKHKRQGLMERTETLYQNNQSLVSELKGIKQKYAALRGAKLSKITLFYWKVKNKIKKIIKGKGN